MRGHGPDLWMGRWEGSARAQCPLEGPAGLLLSSRFADSADLGLPGTLHDRRVPSGLCNMGLHGYEPYTAHGDRGVPSPYR